MTEMTMFRPGDPGFDPAGFQTAYTHQPSVLVAAADAAEVQEAVRYAAAHDLPIAVQTTGHGLTTALDGGMLITTGRMAGVEIDPVAGTARVQAGTTWEAVVDAAGQHGLAPLSGSAPGVGVIGYTLGGGLGLLSRRYGWASDHVRSIDYVSYADRHHEPGSGRASGRGALVTPDGAAHHLVPGDDEFTTLRGDGRDRGVVTGMEIGLVPVAKIYGGGLYFAAEHVPAVLRAYLDWTRNLPDTMTSSVALIPFPDVEGMPPLRGRYLAHVRIVFDGEAAEERLVAPLRAVGPRVIDTLADMPFTESATIYNDPPWPHAYSGTNALLSDLSAEELPSIVDIAGPDAPMMCVVQLNHLGGALARPPAVPDAIAHRDAAYLLRVISPLDGTDLASVRSVHAALMAAVAGTTVGRSPSFVFG